MRFKNWREVRILLKKTKNNTGKEASMHFLLQIYFFKMYALLFMYKGWLKAICRFFILEIQQMFWYFGRTIWYSVHCQLYDYQKDCWIKVTQFFVGYESFVEWKFVQYCFVLAQSNSRKIMVFVGQKQQKFLEMTKSFERDFIFARLHNFKKFNMSLKSIRWANTNK